MLAAKDDEINSSKLRTHLSSFCLLLLLFLLYQLPFHFDNDFLFNKFTKTSSILLLSGGWWWWWWRRKNDHTSSLCTFINIFFHTASLSKFTIILDLPICTKKPKKKSMVLAASQEIQNKFLCWNMLIPIRINFFLKKLILWMRHAIF